MIAYSPLAPIAEATVSSTKSSASWDTGRFAPAYTIMMSVGIGMGMPNSSTMTARRIATKLCRASAFSI